MTATLITGGRIIDPSQGWDATGDLLLSEGVVAWCSLSATPMPELSEAPARVSAAHLVVTPGFIDLHCHLREPGYEAKETIATGTRAAAAGGFTTVCCMPNTSPAIHDRAVVERVLTIAKQQAAVRVLPIGAVTRDIAGKQLAQLGEMADAGCVGFSDDGNPVWDATLMRHAMEYLLPRGLPIIDHCQDPGLTRGSSMNEGPVAARLGLKGWPAAAEDMMIARDIELARLTGARVHIAHLSTAGGVELVRRAKAEGLPVTAEVTPHHLTLTDERVLGACCGFVGLEPVAKGAEAPYDTSAKVNPPLRREHDIAALIEGLLDGTIDCIATDHAPHASEDKLCEFDQAANGISGLEVALGSVLSLVHRGVLPLPLVIEKLTAGPATFLGALGASPVGPESVEGPADQTSSPRTGRSPLVPTGLGSLRVGAPADVAVIGLDDEWIVRPEEFLSKGKNSPLGGVLLKGRVMATYFGGELVYGRGEEFA